MYCFVPSSITAPSMTPATRTGSPWNLPCKPCPEESTATRPRLSSNFQWASRVPGAVAPRALRSSPDLTHIARMSASASVAATSALDLLILNPGERILQCVATTVPRMAPITFATTSTTVGSRYIITSWLVSANVEIKAATIIACSTPISPRTIPTGTYPAMFARKSAVSMGKFSVACTGGRNSMGTAVAARTNRRTGTRNVILSERRLLLKTMGLDVFPAGTEASVCSHLSNEHLTMGGGRRPQSALLNSLCKRVLVVS